jgi:uncharacterized protein (DUF2147 family)
MTGAVTNDDRIFVMKRLVLLASALFALFGTLSVSAAQFASPEGIWEVDTRDSRYEVGYCGDNVLCAQLVWLADSANTPQNAQYLDTLVVKFAKPSGPNKWRGQMSVLGESFSGTIQQQSDDVMEITGCKYVLFCRSFKMYRVADQ